MSRCVPKPTILGQARAFLPALFLALMGSACATSAPYRAGWRAEGLHDYDRAVREYSRALQLSPGNLTYRKSLERARLRAAEEHAGAARLLVGRGLYKEALDEYRLALDLNPSAVSLLAEAREAEARAQAGARAVSLEEIKERAREHGLPGLSLGPEAQAPLGLAFRGASLREAYQALGKAVGVNFVFDPQFQDQPITLDLKEIPFDQALTALSSAGRTFYRVTDSHLITIIPDTPAKRREYEQQVVKTFFLSNADLKETVDLLRIVLGARKVAPLSGSNALTINDAPEKVAAAERIIRIVDKKRAEVVVEVEILEVNRNRLKDYGIEITSSPTGGGIQGAVFPQGASTSLNQNPYTASNLIVTNLPGVIYRLLRTDSSTRLLANPQLRSTEGQTAQAKFGDQVPVPVTVFSPIASGGIAQQPITSFEYRPVGVNIDITPRVHHDGEVTLNLKLEVSSVATPVGVAGVQNLPTFNSRTLNSVIRLANGETSILAGLINDTERTSLTGLPGLANIPLLGRLFAHNHKEVDETDIVMTLTPRILRRAQLTEEDLKSFSLGTESSPILFEVPGVPPPVVNPPRTQEPPRVEPIRPPNPSPTPPPP